MAKPDVASMDPFRVVYRTTGTRSGGKSNVRVYHLDPECSFLRGVEMKKGRLGAQIAAGRRLCAKEAGEPVGFQAHNQETRKRAQPIFRIPNMLPPRKPAVKPRHAGKLFTSACRCLWCKQAVA